jgi:hypothetical protein
MKLKLSHQLAIDTNFQTKIIFVTVCLVIASILIDTSIVKTSVYTGGLHGSTADILVFTVISIIYAVAQYLILRVTIVKERFRTRNMNIVHKSVIILQYILITILLISIVQMILTSNYSSVILKIVTWINYSMSVVFLGLLARKFISWYSSSRNLILIAYAVSMLFLCLASIMSIIDISYGLSKEGAPALISITKSGVALIIAPTHISSIINSAYFIISLLAFISTWLATVLLLKHYSNKIGRAKYWILVSIPLVYFLTQFQTILLYFFTPIRLTDPIIFGITYTLVFSASKPMGGILFGISFWLVSRGLKHPQVKNYMIISGYGLLLLFTASQHQVLQQYPYPPFGLPTICYVGLASYLILIGVYSSALSVAEDKKLRQIIRTSVVKEASLLDSMGTAAMEDRIRQKVAKITKEQKLILIQQTGIESSLDDSEISQFVETVIQEVKRSKRPK